MLFYHESIEVLFIIYLKNKMITIKTNIFFLSNVILMN